MTFKHSSWGKTRSPKNLAGDPGTAITLEANTNADSGRSNANQVPSDREYRVYQIVGIDRVAFVGDDDLANVYAACSTF